MDGSACQDRLAQRQPPVFVVDADVRAVARTTGIGQDTPVCPATRPPSQLLLPRKPAICGIASGSGHRPRSRIPNGEGPSPDLHGEQMPRNVGRESGPSALSVPNPAWLDQYLARSRCPLAPAAAEGLPYAFEDASGAPTTEMVMGRFRLRAGEERPPARPLRRGDHHSLRHSE